MDDSDETPDTTEKKLKQEQQVDNEGKPILDTPQPDGLFLLQFGRRDGMNDF